MTQDVKPMRLRLKTKTGSSTIDGLSLSSTLAELIEAASGVSGISADHITLKGGFPPKTLQRDNLNATLNDLKISNGDVLICEEAAPAEPASNPPSNGPVQAKTGQEYKTVTHDDLIAVDPSSLDGVVVRRIVPADNSCLFNSLSLLLQRDMNGGQNFRRMVADAVRADPITYNEGMLGAKPAEYCAWITDSSHWGGAIDISILTKKLNTEIAVFDTQTLRIDRFGQEDGYSTMVLLIYDGIHYDALAVTPFKGAPEDLDITMFDPGNRAVLAGALRLTQEAHKKRAFTNMAGFALVCLGCQTPLKGQTEALEHAKRTGHTNFDEVH